MPNGGPTPDCFHCKFFKGEIGNENSYKCEIHNIALPYPIRAFCSAFEDLEYADWLEQFLERSQLDAQTVYLWLERDKLDEKKRLFSIFH